MRTLIEAAVIRMANPLRTSIALLLFCCVLSWMTSCSEAPYVPRDHVYVVDDHFHMTQLDKDRRVWIYLPKDYETSGKNYPVLYMQDGQNLFDPDTNGKFDEWKVDEHMRYLEVEGYELIIVAVDHGGIDRVHEYSPWETQEFGGNAPKYLDFLVNELKPYIDTNYRTLQEPQNTAIMGSSLGGLFSHYAVFARPDIFGKAGVFSPPFGLFPESFDYTFSQELPEHLRLYYLAGQVESHLITQEMEHMCDSLKQHGLSHDEIKCVVRMKGKHEEKFWSKEFPHAVRWLFPLTE